MASLEELVAILVDRATDRTARIARGRVVGAAGREVDGRVPEGGRRSEAGAGGEWRHVPARPCRSPPKRFVASGVAYRPAYASARSQSTVS